MYKIYYTIDEKHQISDEEFAEILAGQNFLNQFKDTVKIAFNKYTWVSKGKKTLPDVLSNPGSPKAQLHLVKSLCSGISKEDLEKKYQIKLYEGGSIQANGNEKYSLSGVSEIEHSYYSNDKLECLQAFWVYSFLFWVSEKLPDVEINVYDENLFGEDIPFWSTIKNGNFKADWEKYELTTNSYASSFSSNSGEMALYRSLLPKNCFFVDNPLSDDKDSKVFSRTDALTLGWKKNLSEFPRIYCSDFSEWLSKQKLAKSDGFYFVNLKPYFFSMSESLVQKA